MLTACGMPIRRERCSSCCETKPRSRRLASPRRLFLIFGERWFAAAAETSAGLTLLLFAWLFAAILWGAFGVVRHAEHLAEKLGEPYGTLILTLAVTIIEVAFIVTAIATSTGSSPVARDAVFAVVMIMLNGTIGLCLLLGGLRHHEQAYNLPGARAFLSVVIPLAVFALVLPNFTVVAPGPVLSTPQAITIAVLTLALYGVFLAMQTVRHRSFFQDPVEADGSALPEAPLDSEHGSAHPIAFHAACLLLTLAPAVYLTEELGHIVEHAVKVDRRAAWAGRRDRRGAGAGAGGDGRAAGRACATNCSARSTSRSARCSPPSA